MLINPHHNLASSSSDGACKRRAGAVQGISVLIHTRRRISVLTDELQKENTQETCLAAS